MTAVQHHGACQWSRHAQKVHFTVKQPQKADRRQRLDDEGLQAQLVITAQIELDRVHADTLDGEVPEGRHPDQGHLTQVVGHHEHLMEAVQVHLSLGVNQA